MDTPTAITFIASFIASGIVGSSLTQLTKIHIPDKWRTWFALGVTALVSLAGSGIVWALGDTYTWESLLTQLLAALGVAQATYAIIKPIIPGSKSVDVDALVNQVENLTAEVAKLTAATTAPTTTDQQETTETKQTSAIS